MPKDEGLQSTSDDEDPDATSEYKDNNDDNEDSPFLDMKIARKRHMKNVI